jgi:hypothetical protein
MIYIKTTKIIYDTDGDLELEKSLPQEMFFTFEDADDAEANLADAISDATGWCVCACDYEILNQA